MQGHPVPEDKSEPEGPGCLLGFGVFTAELQRAGSRNQASDWPKIKPVQIISEPDEPQNNEIWTHAAHVFGGKGPFHEVKLQPAL